MGLQTLQRDRNEKRREARALMRSLREDTPPAKARAIESEFDALMSEVDELEERIEEARDRQFYVDPRRPDFGDIEAPGVAGGEPAVDEHRNAFFDWLCDPRAERARSNLLTAERETRVASGTSGATGGYAVPTLIEGDILSRARDANPLRGVVRVLPVETSGIRLPLSNADATSGWVGEGDTRSGTDEPTLDGKVPTTGTCYGLVSYTEELAYDASVDVATWLITEAGAALGEAEMRAIVSGNGTNKPSGILHVAPESGADGTRTADALKFLPSGAADDLGPDPFTLLMGAVYDLHSSYRANGRWLMNSATAGVLRSLKDTDGRFIWAESLMAGQPALLLGYRVTICEGMPDIGMNEHPIAFGDWSRAYVLTQLGGLRVEVGDTSITTPGVNKIYIRERIGGCVYDEYAARVIKCANA
ncbi:MAG: phage major capsid protein [Pseudomonadota bacterium]